VLQRVAPMAAMRGSSVPHAARRCPRRENVRRRRRGRRGQKAMKKAFFYVCGVYVPATVSVGGRQARAAAARQARVCAASLVDEAT